MTMSTKATKSVEVKASKNTLFTEAQTKEVRDIVSDYLTNDNFDVKIAEEDLVNAVKAAFVEDKSFLATIKAALAEPAA